MIFNKGAVMALPSGVNKATGLDVALCELELSPHNVVAIGDAENDHAFLAACECGVAVANGLQSLKDRADLVTDASFGAGVAEVADRLLKDDLTDLQPRLTRHDIPIGTLPDGKQETLSSTERIFSSWGLQGRARRWPRRPFSNAWRRLNTSSVSSIRRGITRSSRRRFPSEIRNIPLRLTK